MASTNDLQADEHTHRPSDEKLNAMKNLLDSAFEQGKLVRGNCLETSTEFMEKIVSEGIEGCAFFVSIIIPMSDIKKPGFHFVVAVRTEDGINFVDRNAIYKDEAGEIKRGTITSQEHYVSSMMDAAKSMNIQRYDFSPVKLNEHEFKIFSPGVMGVAGIVCKQQQVVLTNQVVRRCMVALKAFYHKNRSANKIIEQVIFEVFRQAVYLEGDARGEGEYRIALGNDFRESLDLLPIELVRNNR